MLTKLAGYRILKTLKESEKGAVYLAEHEGLKARRIIKCVHRAHPGYERLVSEAQIMQRFRSEFIPIVFDIWNEQEYTLFSEEFIEGESLRDYLKRKSTISQSEILYLSQLLCDILIFIHNPAHRVLHLDLKPENIMVTDHKLKLIDFGSAICRGLNDEPEEITGTPEFCAPEQKSGGTLNKSTDVYALGKVFEYMLLFAPVAPKGYRSIVKDMLREGRDFEDAVEVKKALSTLSVKRVRHYEMGHWIAVVGIPTDYHSSNFAFGLASVLQKMGKKVIILDVNEKRNLECLEIYAHPQKEPHSFTFSVNGITIAERVLPEDVRGWRGRGFDFVICDFGCQSSMTAEVPFEETFLVGSVAPWTVNEWKNRIFDAEKRGSFAACITEGSASLIKQFSKCRVFEAKSVFEQRKVTRCIKRI